MKNYFDRIKLMIDKEIDFLKNYTIMVVGVGGVGSHTCEALIRSGITNLIVVDYDTVDTTNVNRQLMANEKTIGQDKTKALKTHLLSINSAANITDLKVKLSKSNMHIIDNFHVDFVIDAIDTVTDKLNLIEFCQSQDIYIISALGTGGKIDPTKVKASTLYKTTSCPLARVIRREARKRNLADIRVVYSEEISINKTKKEASRHIPGSMIFVPGTVGYALASEVVKEIFKREGIHEYTNS